MSQLWR